MKMISSPSEQQTPAEYTRRQLLARTIVAAFGFSAAGHAFAAEAAQTGQAPQIILGEGSHRYEWVPDWLTPPDNLKWGDTQGLAQDSAGRIYVSHTVHPDSPSGDAIVVFDKHGKFLTSWGSQFRSGGHGLDVRKEGGQDFLYHCDTAHKTVTKTKLNGEVVWQKGVPVEAGVYKDGSAFTPTNIAFHPDGGFYVADGYGSNWVHQYDAKAQYIRTFGGIGTDPGKLHQPHGLWLDARSGDPSLVVADRANHRMQYFSLEGKHQKFVTEGMRQPCHFKTRGDEMLVPDLDSVVTIVDRDNKVITHLGDGYPSNLRDAPRSAFIPGKFIHPHTAIYLHNGDILVAEWVPIGRITLLRKLA
ncbi:MAG: peptidase [Capsulimonas sp.]|uniref:peptidase n=1 Tax=Capsulimonas sp. TaxID=2494211 RepID=UPI003266D6F8